MQYMLIFIETNEDFEKRNDPEKQTAYYGGWSEYIGAMFQAGIVVNGAGLQPPHTATTIRKRNSKIEIQDGPFADSKEQLGGYFVIEVDNLDIAIDWASKSPVASTGSVEIRPILPPMPQ